MYLADNIVYLILAVLCVGVSIGLGWDSWQRYGAISTHSDQFFGGLCIGMVIGAAVALASLVFVSLIVL